MTTAAEHTAIRVPDIGDFDDVPIIEILVSAGDTVAAEDPLVTLESDKATMDIPAPFAGTVQEIRAKVGDRVSEGDELLTMVPEGENDGDGDGDGDGEDSGPDSVAAEAEAIDQGITQPAAQDVASEAAPAEAESSAPASDGNGNAPGTTSPTSGRGTTGSDGSHPAIYASPSVRRFARELGVSLSGMSGSGRKGRITKNDVEAARRAGGTGGPAAAPGAPAGIEGLSLAPWPKVDFEKFGPVERVPRSRIQKISGPTLARNWVMIPHVTHNDEADITELETWRKQLNTELSGEGVKMTMVSFLVAACVATLKAFPEFNASLDGDELVLRRYWNIGFAADTPGGLVVPVIKQADEKGLVDIARDLSALSSKAREGKLAPGDMSGGTFTISSLGGIGGTSFTPIINAPEVAILGVTRSAMRPVWNGSEFVPRLMVPLSLSYDHRVIDGAAAARFVVHLVGVLSDLRRALL